MTLSINKLLPDPEVVLALEPEELAGVLIEYLNASEGTNNGQLNRYNFSLPHTVEGYPRQCQDRIRRALMEAWVWLEREGLIAPKPGEDGGWVFITRRGKRLQKAVDLEAYRRSDMLPRKILHPLLAQKVWATFLRGDYDTSVFQAFKEVEVQVRETGGYPPEELGVPLMRKAFETDKGPLTDRSAPKAEQEALAHLFAGAIGSYKNPHSHRRITITPGEAVEMVMLASHLLNIVDSRKPN